MNIEKNIVEHRKSILYNRNEVIQKIHAENDLRTCERIQNAYLLSDKAVDYVYGILEESVTKKDIKLEIKKLQWRHRDGKGYSLDSLDDVARKLAKK